MESLGTEAPPNLSDDLLILGAYQKWGAECPRYLLGDFAFAIWDDRRRQLFCCRDHLGVRPFFYWQQDHRFILATDPEIILSAPGVSRELNRKRLAGLATFGTRSHYHSETYHSGILSLPGGSWLQVSATGTKIGTYWQPEIRREVLPRKHEDIIPGLRELLQGAVESRIDRSAPVSSLLSGGLDSSAIVSLAARSLSRQNRELLAVSATVPAERRGRFPDEQEFVEEFRSWPNVNIQYVTAPDSGPFDNIENPERFRHHAWRNPVAFLYDNFSNLLVSRGVKTLMEGTGGELGPTQAGSRHYLELMASFRWLTLGRELRKLKQVKGTSPPRALAQQFRSLCVPARFDRMPWTLFNPEFLREFRPVPCSVERSIHHSRFQISTIRSCMNYHAYRRAHTAGGRIRVTYPFLDKRVIEYCLAAPGSLKVRDGYSRYLIRAALDGILPKKIQWRTSKLVFVPDYNFRYNAQLGKARDFVNAIGPKDPVRSVIDVGSLSRRMHPIADMEKLNPDAGTVVPSTIYAICFLRQFAEFRP